MNFEFRLPDIGEGLIEGEIVKWLVKPGDAVAEHQPLVTVLTDKAEVEIPSPRAGKVKKLFGKPGEKLKVRAPLVILEVAGGLAADDAPPAVKADVQAAPPPSAARMQAGVNAAPMVRRLAADAGADISSIAGSGPQGRVLEADVRNFKGAAPGAGKRATLAVRALAASAGVDLSALKGSGPGGRIVEADVRAAGKKTGAPAFTPPPAASTGEEKVPFVGIRRKIAEKMAFSTRTVARVTHVDECDMTAVIALRDELKAEAAKRGAKLTFLPFVIKALTKALTEFPAFNSSLNEEAGEIVIKRYFNVGVAVAAPQGLVVPNVKGADGLDLFGLAAQLASLTEKARANKIDVASLQGATITITNIGSVGGIFATPIIDHPQVAILGLMKLQKRPMVRDGGIAIRDMMNLALSFDHRVVDGADAARFMNTLIRHLENPRTLV